MYSFSNRVRYSEVNSEKELTLPSLLDYLQDCCTFESEDFGVGVDYLAKEQVAWILSSWEIKVYRYPQMGQHIKVSTWPYAFRGFYGYRNFCIEGEDGEIFAEANSVWVFMDTEKMRPARVSERMQEVYIPESESGVLSIRLRLPALTIIRDLQHKKNVTFLRTFYHSRP